MLYSSPIQLSHVYGPIAHGVLQGGPKMSNANGGFVSVLLTHLFMIWFDGLVSFAVHSHERCSDEVAAFEYTGT